MERESEQQRLGFTFRLSRGSGRLALTDQRFFGWLDVDHLELEVPNLTLPINLAEGPELFQRRRTSVRVATLRLDHASIDRFVTARSPRLLRAGIDDVQVRCGEGYLTAVARVREGNHAADLTWRIYLCGDNRRLRLIAGDARVCGYLPTPAPLLAHRVLVTLLEPELGKAKRSVEGGLLNPAALEPEPGGAKRSVEGGSINALEPEIAAALEPESRETKPGIEDGLSTRPANGTRQPAHATLADGLGDVSVAPLASLLWHTMPAAGWRLPATKNIRLTEVRVSRSGVHLSYAHADGDELARSAARVTELVAALASSRNADNLLRAGDYDGALRAYRAELTAGGFDQPHVLSRLLALTSARSTYFIDGAELARQVLGRWPDFPAAHAALASIATFQGDHREAAERFRHLARGHGGEDDDLTTSRAALAAARILRRLAPTESTALYEQVLAQEQGHAEAAEALADRYTSEERWHDLERLIRERIAATADRVRQSRDRVRLADVLWHRIGDVDAARAQLEQAAELDADNIAALETLAELQLSRQDPTSALRAIDRAIRVFEQRGDTTGQARLHSRAAAVWEQLGDRDNAQVRYQRAMALAPQLVDAVTGAARLAEQRGAYADAATLWARLIDAGGQPTVVNAEYTCELARCLLGSGDKEAAIPLLERAADVGRPATVAEAHTLLAELYIKEGDIEAGVEELGIAIAALVPTIDEAGDPLRIDLAVRAAKLALRRAGLIAAQGNPLAAAKNFEQAYQLAHGRDAGTSRDAARALLGAAAEQQDPATQQRWIEAILAAGPNAHERADLLMERARLAAAADRRDDALADVEAAIAAAPDEQQHAAALGLKAWILDTAGDALGRARSLAERASLASGVAARIDAETAAAAAWLDADDRDEALAASRRAVTALAELDRTSGDFADLERRALAVLGEAAWRSRAWAEVVNAYRPLFAIAALAAQLSGAERARGSRRLGIALEKRGDRVAAVAALQRATTEPDCPGDIRAASFKLLADIYQQLNQPLEAARALEQFAADQEAEATGAARADAWYRAGDSYRKHGRTDDAERCLDAALRLAQDHLPALDALELIKRDAKDYERVAVILGRKIAATARHPNRQKALLVRLAELQLEQLDRPDVARASSSRALEIDPDYRPALRYVARDALEGADVTSAAEAYARLARELPGDADLADDAGSLLGERIDAAITLAELALGDGHDSSDSGLVARAAAALDGLREAAADDPRLRAARARLEQHSRPEGNDGEDGATDGEAAPRAIDRSVVDLARSYLRIGRRGRAIAVLKGARDDGLLSSEGEQLLVELLAADDLNRTESDAELALTGFPTSDKLRETAARALASGDTLLAADLLAESVDARARALAIHGRTLDDALSETLAELRQLADAHGHWAAYAEALLTASAVEHDKPGSAALLCRAARLYVDHLDDARGAADALSRALALTPHDTGLVTALIALLESAGDQAAMFDVYELHLQALGGRDRARPLLELGLLHQEVGDAEAATTYLAQAHAADAQLAEVWVPLATARIARGELEQARGLLELALSSAQLSGPERETVQVRLQEVKDAIAALTERAVTAFLDDAAKVENQLRLGAQLQKSGQIDAAIAHYEAVAAAAPRDRRPLECLMPLYRARRDPDALTELLGRMIVITESPQEKAELWFRRAKLYRDELHREPETYRCLKEAHANAPDNPHIAHALRAIAMARGEWALAAELIYRELDNAEDDREAGALHLELALIYDEKLLDAEQALRNYEQALSLDPEIPAAPRPLARLYELAGRHGDAARMGERAAELIGDDDERGRMLKHAAVSAERAKEPELARRLYNLAAMAVADDSDSRAAQAALARLSGDGGAMAPESELLRLRLLETETAEERGDLLRQILELAVAEGDEEAIRKHAEALLEADHADLSAYLTLKARAEAAGDATTLASLIGVRAGAIDDAAERAALYDQLGRLCRDELRDPNRAIGAFQQALAAEPDHPGALEALADIAYRKHDWKTARKLYAQLRPETSSLPADALAYRRGEINEVLGRDQDALDAFLEASRLNDSNRDAFVGVARTAIRVGDTRTAINATRALIELLPRTDVPAITAARLRLAQMCHHAGDADAAIEYYELVLAEDARSLPTLRALTQLYQQGQNYTAAARTLHALIGLAPSPAQRAELLYDLGELYRRRLGDRDLAADAYLKAIDLDPAHAPTLRRLIDYYWRIDEHEALLEIANDLHEQTALIHDDTEPESLARTLVVTALHDRLALAREIGDWLAEETAGYLADALIESASQSVDTTPGQLAAAARQLAETIEHLHLGQLVVLVEGEISDGAGRSLLAALRTANR